MNKKILLLVLILCIAVGYISGFRSVEANNGAMIDNQDDPLNVAQSCNNSLAFESLDQGEYLPGLIPNEPSTIIVSDWSQAEELKRLFSSGQHHLFQSVDYSEYFVFIVLLGVRGHGGIEILIDEVCIHEKTISIEAQEFIHEERHLGLTTPYHMVRVKKNGTWSQDMDFVLSLDGQQVFTQTHYIPEPRRWNTLDKHYSSMAGTPDLLVIATEDEISSVADLLSQKALSALQELDYEESYALVAFQGYQPSGGYDIEIEDFIRQGNRVVIRTQATEPDEDTPVTPEGTSPYHLIGIDRFYENSEELNFVLSVNGTEVLTRTTIIGQKPSIPTPTPVPTSTPPSTPTVPVIKVGEYTVEPGGKIDVLIDAIDFEDVGAINVIIGYDPSVLQVVSCSTSLDGDEFYIGFCNTHYLSDTIHFNIAAWQGINGDVNLAEATFEVIGEIGNVSPLHLEVITLVDTYAQVLAADTINGQISISNQLMGDMNCDGKRNSVDGLFILQYNAALRAESKNCVPSKRDVQAFYESVCDVNQDGQCDAVDAMVILQCDVGLLNEPCSRRYVGQADK